MITKKILFLSLISTLLFLSSCKKDDNNLNSDPFYQQISDETLKWIKSYEAEGQEIIYVNSSNDTTKLMVDFMSDLTTPFYVDCMRDGEIVQCDYKNVSIDFPNEFDPPNEKMEISIALFANYDVRIMPTRSGVVLSAGRLDDETKEVKTESDTHFEVSYLANYSFSGNTYEAIIINTLTTENLPTGGSVTPKSMVFAKAGGILTWDDYDGVTWDLVQ